MMIALVYANPDAFCFEQNMNCLRVAAYLRAPSEDELAAITDAAARSAGQGSAEPYGTHRTNCDTVVPNSARCPVTRSPSAGSFPLPQIDEPIDRADHEASADKIADGRNSDIVHGIDDR